MKDPTRQMLELAVKVADIELRRQSIHLEAYCKFILTHAATYLNELGDFQNAIVLILKIPPSYFVTDFLRHKRDDPEFAASTEKALAQLLSVHGFNYLQVLEGQKS